MIIRVFQSVGTKADIHMGKDTRCVHTFGMSRQQKLVVVRRLCGNSGSLKCVFER